MHTMQSCYDAPKSSRSVYHHSHITGRTHVQARQGFSTYLIALRGNISHNEGRRADEIYGRSPLLGCLGCRILNSTKRRDEKGKGGKGKDRNHYGDC